METGRILREDGSPLTGDIEECYTEVKLATCKDGMLCIELAWEGEVNNRPVVKRRTVFLDDDVVELLAQRLRS